jgi:xanthine dehydrogenase YagS FAD-binding subunit
MMPFAYARASSVEDALSTHSAGRAPKFLGGGTNLIDLMKMGVEQPAELIDITRLPLSTIEESNGGVRIGAMVSNSALAANALIRERYPVLSQALLSGASPQIRNMATVGGNLLQRTRCYYFYDPSYAECNKRQPGSGCAAIGGYNRIHAILGGSAQCIATHPSDMAVALAALDASVRVRSAAGERLIAFSDFYRLPGETPNVETTLRPGELITSIEISRGPAAKSLYIKVRDRNSYAFALVSVAAVMDLSADGTIQDARIALGGVAPRPWRAPDAEQFLRGKKPDDATLRQAALMVTSGAKPYRHNAFKVELAQRTVVRAIASAAGLA